jgi:hypothetical protein
MLGSAVVGMVGENFLGRRFRKFADAPHFGGNGGSKYCALLWSPRIERDQYPPGRRIMGDRVGGTNDRTKT